MSPARPYPLRGTLLKKTDQYKPFSRIMQAPLCRVKGQIDTCESRMPACRVRKAPTLLGEAWSALAGDRGALEASHGLRSTGPAAPVPGLSASRRPWRGVPLHSPPPPVWRARLLPGLPTGPVRPGVVTRAGSSGWQVAPLMAVHCRRKEGAGESGARTVTRAGRRKEQSSAGSRPVPEGAPRYLQPVLDGSESAPLRRGSLAGAPPCPRGARTSPGLRPRGNG